MNHIYSRRVLIFASILITILLALNIFFTYRNSQEIEKNRLQREQTEAIKAALTKIAIDVIHNLDLGIRSYALFEDARYLYPYQVALRERHKVLSKLEEMLSQQNYPLTEFYRLRDSINFYTDLNRNLKTIVDNGQLSEFKQLADRDQGYHLWLQYERFSGHVHTFENQIHMRATRHYEQALRNNYLTQLSLFLICIPTLLITVLYTNRAFTLEAKLKDAETERAHLLSVQNEELEKKVLERTNEIQEKSQALREKNIEIAAQNEELIQQQHNIALQRDMLSQQNQKLSEAQEIILTQNESLASEVARKTKEIIAYNQQLEQFAFAAAHNLRSPVARILGLGEVLRLVSGKPEEKDVINHILTSVATLDRVIKDLNMILEIKSNINTQLSKMDFIEEVRFILANLEKEMSEAHCEITTCFQEAPSVFSVKAYIDSILFNLLSNALKYRSPERQLRIFLHTFYVDGFICLEIADNGIGIDLQAYGKDVFSLYKRFNTHTEGKGLGLYLVKMQATALGGRAEVSSIPNQGTTFKIYFKNSLI
jgi:signal transduction histidine kinase